MTEELRLSRVEAAVLISKALEENSVSRANAASVAAALVDAEADGQKGHGFSRVLAYCAQARAGKVKGEAEPVCETVTPAFLLVDAMNGFAFPAIDMAIEQLVPLTRKTGIAGAAITRSHHCGQLGAPVERLAERGIMAIMVANTPKSMAPWGGNEALFGTNPIAFSVPRHGNPPMVMDLSLSKVARGKIMAASQTGDPIPAGWALDADGNETTDAKAALGGTMLPAGDAKGAALALMVEVLAASLTGANYSYEASTFFNDQGPPPGTGQFFITIDAGQVTHNRFAARFEKLVTAITDQEGARLPGTSRLAAREAADRDGLIISRDLHAKITALTGN